MEWKTYPGDRLIAEHPDGFYVIMPKEISKDSQPIFCPLCEGIMGSSYDAEMYSKFGVCDLCSSRWVYPNTDRWVKGWRPTAEEVHNKT